MIDQRRPVEHGRIAVLLVLCGRVPSFSTHRLLQILYKGKAMAIAFLSDVNNKCFSASYSARGSISKNL